VIDTTSNRPLCTARSASISPFGSVLVEARYFAGTTTYRSGARGVAPSTADAKDKQSRRGRGGASKKSKKN
jgi:hypothetical protein